MNIEAFLSADDEQKIVAAIADAERQTSGEIKVHIDRKCRGDALKRAIELFGKMELHKTQQRNGVLIYVAIDDHKLAIFGDEGIHSCVSGDFWQYEVDLIAEFFRRGEFRDGLTRVIHEIGQKLQEKFPYDAKSDTNELPDDISFGEGK